MTEITAEGLVSATTAAVIDNKNGAVPKPSSNVPKKSVADDLASTFSSPTALLLVVALIVTWSAVAIVMFDLMDYKSYVAPYTQYCDDPCLPPGAHQPGFGKALKEAKSPIGGISKLGSDPMKVIDEVVEESTDWIHGVMSLLSDMIAPDDDDDDEGDTEQPPKRRGEAHPSKRKGCTVMKKNTKETTERKSRDEKKAPPKEVKKVKVTKAEEKTKMAAKPEKKVEKAKKEMKAVEKTKPKARPKQEKPSKTESKDQFEFCRYVVGMYTHEDVSSGVKAAVAPALPKGSPTTKKPAAPAVEGLKEAVTTAPPKENPTTKKPAAPAVEEKKPVVKPVQVKKEEPKKKPSQEPKRS
ncbi:triadin-like [Acipenser oxyrinchus oxyrinchus]|uniref:Triadin-like n=1 Tax=Acipenser oxyrinchus oxyrinchus TaxID=40147 RepID=A0AAD8GAS1_ACIOX|nr:triadin-like [Acipenser oxyrinchus oxyrinchus]